MDNTPLVSIMCIAYNHEKYIADTLDGFVKQKTTFPFEVIVHDDASTDLTAKVIKEYETKYPEIIKPIFQTENQYSQGKRILFSIIGPKCRGKYFAICEGDDYWNDENKLQKQVDFMEQHEEYVACVHNSYIDNLANREKKIGYSEQDKDLTFFDVIEHGGQSYHTSSLLFRGEIYRQRPEWSFMMPGVEDYPLAIYFTIEGKVKYFGEVMSTYRMGTPGSWTLRVQNNYRRMAENCKNTIAMLREVDIYTKHQYSDVILKSIIPLEYYVLMAENRFSRLMKEPFKTLFMKEPLTERVRIFLFYCTPHLRAMYRKVKK